MDTKSKLSDFEFNGDIYKVKTFREITKLERNGVFVYESVPGTAVNNFYESDKEMTFTVEGMDDASITVEAENGAEYKVSVDGINVGTVTANMGGKLVFSVELNPGRTSDVKLIKQ